MVPLIASAVLALLPGVRTPTHNISCFVVPIKPTVHSNLLCAVKRSYYGLSLQHYCVDGPPGVDWQGFELPWNGAARVECSGGVLYDIGRDTPHYRVLAYGSTWRSHRFTCKSRRTGLTCTNARGHGLFLSRESYKLF